MDAETREIDFPYNGIDLSRGLNDQREGTSPFAVNVRGYGVDGRLRGGCRPGLTPYFGPNTVDQVAGFFRIQSLSAIVTASQGATFSSNKVILTLRMDYSEANSPPARDAPQKEVPITWYEGTKPNVTGVTNVIVGTPDGGGTGQGTAKFKIETDGVTVTLTATFVSAGFPGPYFYSGPEQVQTITQTFAQFFNPAISKLAGSWTVVAGSFIAVYPFNVFWPGP